MSVVIGRPPEIAQTDYLYRQGLEEHPIWKDEDGKFTKLGCYGNHRYDYNGNQRNTVLRLVSIDDFVDNFDVEKFIEEFLMKPKRELLTDIDDFNYTHRYYMDRLELKKLGINKKFGWKPGCYNTIRRLILEMQGHMMKPIDMTSFGDRRARYSYQVDRLNRRLLRLEDYRRTAKMYSIDSTIDLEEGKELFNQVIQIQQNNTELANNNWDNNMKITHYFGNKFNDDGDLIHKTSFFTFVEIEPCEMLLQDGDMNNLGKARLRKTYLLFERSLMDLLEYQSNPNNRPGINLKLAAYPSVMYRHPYINRGGAYTFHEGTRQAYANPSMIYKDPWGSLCLSDYDSEICNSLQTNDYMSLASGISMWTQVYNIHTTNPYNNPHTFMTDLSNVKTLKKIGYQHRECFSNIYYKLENTLLVDDKDIKNYNSRLYDSLEVKYNHNWFHESIKEICDERNCKYRSNCDKYQMLHPDWKEIMLKENEDFLEMLEQVFAHYWMVFDIGIEWTIQDWWNFLNTSWGSDWDFYESMYEQYNKNHFPELYPKLTKAEKKEVKLEQDLTREELMSSIQHWQYSDQ